LMRSITTPGAPLTSWLSSIYFKFWVASSLSGLALLVGSIHIETVNLDMMKVGFASRAPGMPHGFLSSMSAIHLRHTNTPAHP
jgi:hypothetical protein